MKLKQRSIFSIIILLIFAIIITHYTSLLKVKAESNHNLQNGSMFFSERSSIVSKDGSTTLFMDENGHFELKDNRNGKSWYSISQNQQEDNSVLSIEASSAFSELVIEYLLRIDENTQYPTQKSNSYVLCEKSGDIEVTKIKDGFKVLYTFDGIDIKIPLLYVLDNSELTVSVDISGIDEGKECYLVSLDVLPYFGSANNQTSGYLFIPDGSGTIAEFNQNIEPIKTYAKRVYGEDAAHSSDAKTSKEYDIKMPVFGMVHENSALMGVITEGDGAAVITAKTSNASNPYNSINSKMLYRIHAEGNAIYKAQGTSHVYTVTHNDFGADKYTVRFYTLANNDASYSGMARKYSEYLKEKYLLKNKTDAPSLAIKAYGCIEEKKNFLGFIYYDKLSLTTYNQAQTLLSDLTDNGVDGISFQYQGWSGNGYINRKLPIKANALSVLGGKKDLKQLIEFSKGKNIDLYLNTDILNYKSSGNGVWLRKHSSKSPNGDVAKIYDYSIVTYAQITTIKPNYLLSSKFFSKFLTKFEKNYSKLGLDTISLSNCGNEIYSDFKTGDVDYRTVSIKRMQDNLSILNKKYNKIALNDVNAYAIPYTTIAYEVPVASSGYDIFSYDIPFYQMVVSEFMNYTTPSMVQAINEKDMFLKAIETGSSLLYDCVYYDSSVLRDTSLSNAFSSQYSIWKNEAINNYKEIKKLYIAINSSYIIEHKKVAENVFCTEFSNGCKVYVNYNEDETTVDGLNISAKGYVIEEAENEKE